MRSHLVAAAIGVFRANRSGTGSGIAVIGVAAPGLTFPSHRTRRLTHLSAAGRQSRVTVGTGLSASGAAEAGARAGNVAIGANRLSSGDRHTRWLTAHIAGTRTLVTRSIGLPSATGGIAARAIPLPCPHGRSEGCVWLAIGWRHARIISKIISDRAAATSSRAAWLRASFLAANVRRGSSHPQRRTKRHAPARTARPNRGTCGIITSARIGGGVSLRLRGTRQNLAAVEATCFAAQMANSQAVAGASPYCRGARALARECLKS